MFLFLKMEDVGGNNVELNDGVLFTEGGEGESVSAAIEEVTVEERAIEEIEETASQEEHALDTIDEAAEATDESLKQEGQGMSAVQAKLLKNLMTRVVGKQYTNRHFVPRMENFSSRSDRREATGYTSESLKDTLKKWWELLKKTINDAVVKVKSWGVKAFSSAKKLADKAEQVRNRAEQMSSTIDKKTFVFSQADALAVDGKLRDVSKFKTALESLIALTNEAASPVSKKQLDTFRSELDKLDVSSGDFNTQTLTLQTNVVSETSSLLNESNNSAVEPKVIEDLGDRTVITSKLLPGDIVLMASTPKSGSTTRGGSIGFINTKKNPRKFESGEEVQTLNASDAASLAASIKDGADNVFDWEKSFNERAKVADLVQKKLDEIVREAIDKIRDAESDTQQAEERNVRSAGGDLATLFRRANSTPTMIVGQFLRVGSATLNWCEGSMANYKQA